VIYDSTVTPLPGNFPSLGYQATSTSEFGDEINFAGTFRLLQQVTVTLSSWGCETRVSPNNSCVTNPGATFAIPITSTIYNVGEGDTVGTQIATLTQTFNVPYRPSQDDTNCAGSDAGKWYSSSDGKCNNGLATNITFDFSALATVTLPDSVIYGISYNTSTHGYSPIGTDAACFSTPAGCPYDSLNVALTPAVTVGSQVNPGKAFLNSTWTGAYCDNGADGTGSFRLDSPTSACWTGYVPAVQFTAGTPPATGNLAWLYNFVRQFYAFRGR